MQISYIEKTGKYKLRITLDNDETFIISEKEWRRYGKEVGDELSEADHNRLFNEYFLPKAKLRALNLLKMRDRSRKEIIQRLKNDGCPDEIIQKTLEYVDQYHYLDDERFTRNYVEYRGTKKSLRELESELAGKGIHLRSMAEEIEMELPDDRETIHRILEKKWGDHQPDQREKDRMTRYLGRRGFRMSDIFYVYDNLDI